MNYSLLLSWLIFTNSGTWYNPPNVPYELTKSSVEIIDSIETNNVEEVVEIAPYVFETNIVEVITTNSHWETKTFITKWSVTNIPQPDLTQFTEADEVQARAAYESHRQASKPLKLRIAENKYLAMCDLLTGATNHTKLGFDELTAIILAMPQEQQIIPTLQLLALDAELKREGGLKWWDDCAWHPELE